MAIWIVADAESMQLPNDWVDELKLARERILSEAVGVGEINAGLVVR